MQFNDDEVKSVFSKNIKVTRNSVGLTQEALAEDSAISLNFLKDIESARSGVSLSTLVNLSKSLKSSPNQLLKDFFKEDVIKSENILQQINLLNEYERDAVITLINYFNMHNSK